MNRTTVKIITSLLTFCFLVSIIPISAVKAQRERRVTSPALVLTTAPLIANSNTSAVTAFPADEPVTVDLEIDEDSIACLSGREVTEQIRDWLLFTVVSSSALSPGEVNEVFYDLPASRCGYLDGVANFDYGPTRSRYIGNGQIVALLPPAESNARLDQLGRIVDEHRKNVGEVPSAITVFEYNIDLSTQTANITQRGTVDAQRLFTESNGYYTSTVNNLGDLERFMKQIDDLTYASVEGSALVLGGRKIKNRSYQGIRVEDVAAIWKSEVAIAANETRAGGIEKEFHEAWSTLNDIFEDFTKFDVTRLRDDTAKLKKIRDDAQIRRQTNPTGPATFSPAISAYDGWQRIQTAILNHNLAGIDNEIKRIKKLRSDQRAAVEAILLKQGKSLSLARESGFSLDPTYDFEGLSKFFAKELEPVLREIAASSPKEITQREITAAKTALTNKDPDPFLRLLGKLSKAGDTEIAELIHDATKVDYAFQHARYDGELKGTEVGMVLFYTDLLAKLWALDFMNSTPSKHIRGFYPLSDAPVSPVHQANVDNFSDTRLWFGPRNQGFQLAGDNSNKMFFGRTATRVYSASHDPFAPGEEQEGNASAAEFLGWWDAHYDEIARYEPQYERLNEIMKWSVVIGWLSNSERLSSMNFLKDVAVNNSNRFPDWVNRNPNLKFQDWKEIGFHPAGYKNSSTESLPLLTSPSGDLMGGVSLGGKEVFRSRTPLTSDTKVSALGRRSNRDYSAASSPVTTGSESFKSIEGSTYTLSNDPGPIAELVAKAKERISLRDSASELNPSLSFSRKLTKNAQSLKLETSAGQVPVGELKITKLQNGFEIGSQSRALEAGHAFGRQLSLADNPDALIKSHPDVQTAYKLSESDYVVKLRGQNKWHRITFDDGASPLPVGYDSRIAEIDGERVVNMKAVDSPGPQATPAKLLRSDRLPSAGEPIPTTEFARLDTLIADKPVKALREVNEMIQTHGATPELLLRHAVAQIRRGKTVEAARGLDDFVTAAGNKANSLIEDMNTLLTSNGLIPKGEGLFVINDENQVSLGYRVAKLQPTPGGFDPAKDYVYMDLSFVDRSPATLGTVQQILANGLGETVRIPSRNIGKYRPVYISEGPPETETGPRPEAGGGRTFKIASDIAKPPRIRPIIPCLKTDDERKDDDDVICDDDDDQDRSIYLLVPKTK